MTENLKYQYVVHAETNCIYNAAFKWQLTRWMYTLRLASTSMPRMLLKVLSNQEIERVVSPDFTDPVKRRTMERILFPNYGHVPRSWNRLRIRIIRGLQTHQICGIMYHTTQINRGINAKYRFNT